MTDVLAIDRVSLALSGRPVLDAVTLNVAAGEVVVLAGPSGSGKSSLLRVVLGLMAPTSGSVSLRGVRASAPGRVLVPPEERSLAVVFQDLALWPHLTVRRNLTFGLERSGLARAQIDLRAGDMLARVGLAGFEARLPHTLSGGERQRVAIARALVSTPDLALFDEPLASLDVVLKRELLGLIRDLLRERGAAALFTTHDPREADFFGGRIAILEAGRLSQIGTPCDLRAAPGSAFVRAFAGEGS